MTVILTFTGICDLFVLGAQRPGSQLPLGAQRPGLQVLPKCTTPPKQRSCRLRQIFCSWGPGFWIPAEGRTAHDCSISFFELFFCILWYVMERGFRPNWAIFLLHNSWFLLERGCLLLATVWNDNNKAKSKNKMSKNQNKFTLIDLLTNKMVSLHHYLGRC